MSIKCHTRSRFTPRGLTSNSFRPKGFTLIELLVVIAIIAILAAILFPVFAQARENARKTACLSNLKQIGLGLMQYAQDYDERLPFWQAAYITNPSTAETPEKLWKSAVHPYIKGGNSTSKVVAGTVYAEEGVWRCPSIELWKDGLGAPNTRTATASYGISMAVAYKRYGPAPASPETRYYSGLPLASLRAPADTIFAGEGGVAGRIDTPANYRWRSYNNLYRTSGAPYVQNWERRVAHMGGSNYLFTDGHAKWLKAETAYPDDPGVTANGPGALRAAFRYHTATQEDHSELLRLYPNLASTP